MSRTLLAAALLVTAGALLPGCVVYEPYPGYAGPATYDRAWNAALGALQDAGVQVTAAETGSGVIRGTRSGIDVVVTVMREASGQTRVQFDARGPTDRDPGLANRFSQAYERRMGR